jgi:hypothetical protein
VASCCSFVLVDQSAQDLPPSCLRRRQVGDPDGGDVFAVGWPQVLGSVRAAVAVVVRGVLIKDCGSRPVPSLSGPLPPSRAFPRSGCPQLHQPAATGQRWSPSTSTRSHSASWRTGRNRMPAWSKPGCEGTAPSCAAAVRCGRDPQPFQHPPHCRGSNADAEAEQLAMDPLAAPAWIFLRHPLDSTASLASTGGLPPRCG